MTGEQWTTVINNGLMVVLIVSIFFIWRRYP